MENTETNLGKTRKTFLFKPGKVYEETEISLIKGILFRRIEMKCSLSYFIERRMYRNGGGARTFAFHCKKKEEEGTHIT